jgi:hypothetical protein
MRISLQEELSTGNALAYLALTSIRFAVVLASPATSQAGTDEQLALKSCLNSMH